VRMRIDTSIKSWKDIGVVDPILQLCKEGDNVIDEAAMKLKVDMKMCVTRDALVIWIVNLKKVFAYSVSSMAKSFISIPLSSKYKWDEKAKRLEM
jgi:hypothetical protein